MPYKKECVLEAKECIDCGECDICDLNPDKICDNCCQCIDGDADFKGIYIDDIIENDAEEEEIENTVFKKDVTEEIE
jgi:hypothetical protein